MGGSDDSTSNFIGSVVDKIRPILDRQDLQAGIRDVLEKALSILELVNEFETNKMDILFIGLLVAQIAECVADSESSEWTDQHFVLLKTALENLLSYLEVIEVESSRWKEDKTDEKSQIARADEFSIDLSKHKEELENVALVLQLKLQARQDVKLNETNDAVLNLVENVKGVGGIMEHIEQNMESNISKLDAILECAAQVQRSFDVYQRDVSMHNRPSDANIFHSLQMLQDEVDLEANKNRQSSRPLNSKEHIKKWMISSKALEFNTEESIGGNDMATVYKGFYMGKNVAVKQFHGILNTDSADLERDVDREIKQWAKVGKLPFVSNLIGVCTKTSRLLIVSEWSPKTISAFLDTRPTRLLQMIYELISGLVSIHDRGIIHGNLKAANVLVTQQNRVAITDFGLSKSVVTTMSRITSRNEPVHMINWSSPEILFAARRAGPPADMWSFGMTVYELLAKDIPFKDYKKFDIERAVRTDHERPPRPADLNPALDPLWHEIEKCWRQNPTERPTASEFQKFIEDNYSVTFEPGRPGNVAIHVHSARSLRNTQAVRRQDPFVEIQVGDRLFKTRPHENGHIAPSWDESFNLECNPAIENPSVSIRVVTKNLMGVGQNEIAHTTLALRDLLTARSVNKQPDHPEHKLGFQLHPNGRIVIDANIITHEDAQSETKPKRYYMRRICANVDDEDCTDDPDDGLKSTTVVVGPFGTGKTTLINSILGENMYATSMWGGCTQDVRRIRGAAGFLTLFDTPSYPFSGDQSRLLRMFKKCRVVVIVFDRTVDEVIELVTKARAEKCVLIFVRSKRDLLPHLASPNGPDVSSILESDREDIKRCFGLKDIRNFYIDAKAVLRARLSAANPVNLDLLEDWISLLKAIRIADDKTNEDNYFTNLMESIPSVEEPAA
ncbi:hypothetical protein LEN26_006403 [Aphanomyces euteiches]|nr:hypothetical protein AeMF1_001106 [Aphanomyces euteiches]KAH9135471.1 hypothetical protein LEN26_006403 [Aphanomyces euteiches]KAH9192503.1 hypothetical protein AeNC1_005513 [Aphanomyces euteiches]